MERIILSILLESGVPDERKACHSCPSQFGTEIWSATQAGIRRHHRRCLVTEDVNKTWKPVAAGIFSLLVGVFNTQYRIAGIWLNNWSYLGLVGSIIGIVGIIGGVFAIKRQKWILALMGAICTLYPSHSWGYLAWTPILGIFAIVLVVQSKEEFSS